MDGLCSIIAHKMVRTLSEDYFNIGSILFSIVSTLKLFDPIICDNIHIQPYAVDIIKQKTGISIKFEELSEIVEYYNRNDMVHLQFRGQDLNIPKVVATNKLNCQDCNSSLSFNNDRKPFISTLYDLNDGSTQVSITNLEILNFIILNFIGLIKYISNIFKKPIYILKISYYIYRFCLSPRNVKRKHVEKFTIPIII